MLTGVGACLFLLPALVLAEQSAIQSQICEPFETPVITAPPDNTQTNDSSTHVAGTAEPGLVVTIVRNGSGAGAGTAAPDGSYQIEVPLTGGNNTLIARTTNDCDTIHDSATTTIFRILRVVPEDPTAGVEITGLEPPGSASPAAPATPGTGEAQVPLQAPRLTRPTPGLRTPNERLWVNGTAQPGGIIAILVNSIVVAQVITSEDGTFGAMVTLWQGKNTVQAVLSQGGQSASSPEVTVEYLPGTKDTPKSEPEDGPNLLLFVVGTILLGVLLYAAIILERWVAVHRRKGPNA